MGAFYLILNISREAVIHCNFIITGEVEAQSEGERASFGPTG